MTREETLKTVTHTGDCYRIKLWNEPEPFNFYVSKIGSYGLEQEASELPYRFVSYQSLEWVKRY